MTRAEAEDILRDRPDFSFLVRKSESCQTDYSLSIRYVPLFVGLIARICTIATLNLSYFFVPTKPKTSHEKYIYTSRVPTEG